MPTTLKQAVAEARPHPTDQVSERIDQLRAECLSRPDPEIDDAWRSKTRRRVAEIRSAKLAGVPSEEATSEGRRIAGR